MNKKQRLEDKKEQQIIRDFAITDHKEGNRPFATEHTERMKNRNSGTPEKPKDGKCAHCEGLGKCECPACTLRRTDKPVACSMCQVDKHKLFVAFGKPAEDWFEVEKRIVDNP